MNIQHEKQIISLMNKYLTQYESLINGDTMYNLLYSGKELTDIIEKDKLKFSVISMCNHGSHLLSEKSKSSNLISEKEIKETLKGIEQDIDLELSRYKMSVKDLNESQFRDSFLIKVETELIKQIKDLNLEKIAITSLMRLV